VLEAVDRADDEEDDEGNDEEVDGRLYEEAVIERGGPGVLRRLEGWESFAAEADEEVAEVDAVEDEAERRHEDVFHERVYDRAERAADDDRDG